VLGLIADQRAANVLVEFIGDKDLSVRASVLDALNVLRPTEPRLEYDQELVDAADFGLSAFGVRSCTCIQPLSTRTRR
jgi:HEAT repeat protein